MLKRLGAHDQIVEVLLTKGFVVQALRFASKLHKRSPNYKLIPRRFLEAARDDMQLFFTGKSSYDELTSRYLSRIALVYNFFDQLALIDASLADFQTLYREQFLEEPPAQ